MDYIRLHKNIEKLLSKTSKEAVLEDVLKFVSKDRDYFFARADGRWLRWLWKNGFLDVLKKKAEDAPRYGYQSPEINYLLKVSEKNPSEVVDIMLEIPISRKTFNPEVIDRFLRICSELSAKQLARIVGKIHRENWVKLMGSFKQYGFEYEKMFRTLVDVKDYMNILKLVETVLSVRTKKEMKTVNNRPSSENPFYFGDLSSTKVIEHLFLMSEKYTEKALKLVTKVMAKIVNLGEKSNTEKVFEINDLFPMYVVDFFTLELDESEYPSYEKGMRDLAAIIKIFLNRLISKKCEEIDLIREVYEKYIEPLPDSRSMWRLRLFVLCLCPKVFKNELKEEFFRLFEAEHYYEIISGAEYEKALRKGFSVLSNDDKGEYVKMVVEYFKNRDKDKEDRDQSVIYGSRVLSMIIGYLTNGEEKKIEKAGFILDPSYKPKPSIGPLRSGTVISRGPIPQEVFNKLEIKEIVQNLKTEWVPEKLKKQNTNNSSFDRINARGIGKYIQSDIPNRLQDYINSSLLFFDRNVIDPHYTYSFLRGLQETISKDKEKLNSINWDGLIDLLTVIKESGEKKSFVSLKRDYKDFDTWLAGWNSVHCAMADIIKKLLEESNGKVVIDFPKYRDQIFDMISYLLRYPDPTVDYEKLETASMTEISGVNKDKLVSDPFSIAINSVRGKAFEAFVYFVFQDGKKFDKKVEVKISRDVKKLYEYVLTEEKTRAIYFMFGHYLPSFYFRDKKWILDLTVKIFPLSEKKKHLYIASWEGYLSNDLFEEIFFDKELQKLYKKGLSLNNNMDPNRKYFKDLKEGIAIHLALAFVHYKEFGFDDTLFKAFWRDNDYDRQASFLNFLGRYILGDNNKVKELLKKKWCKDRLCNLWDRVLENRKNPRLFEEFGHWMNTKVEVFEIHWLSDHVRRTLEKTKGVIEYEYGLIDSIVQFAKDSPKDTLEISKLYLLEGFVRLKKNSTFSLDEEWVSAFSVLYANQETKSGTYLLINDLIREGGSMFWKLKDAIKETK